MNTVRRWYIYLSSIISLQAVTWAVIALLRNLLSPSIHTDAAFAALQISIIIIGTPVYIVHWLWAQRLAEDDIEERSAILRRVYLYGILAVSLGPFLANTYELLVSGRGSFTLTAMVVMTVVWLYHQRILKSDVKTAPETGNNGTVRRLYVLGFSAGGLTMTSLAVIHMIRMLMFLMGGDVIRVSEAWKYEIVRLLLGCAIWIVFWIWAQRLFTGTSEEEHRSVLRKVYLYAAVFAGVLAVVANTTGILAGYLKQVMEVFSYGGGGDDIRQPLPIVLGMLVVWAYHAYVLRADASQAKEVSQQAGIRRLYLYLVAGIGLAAFLVGTSGILNVLLRTLGGTFFGNGMKVEFAWFVSLLIAGLPVWILPWREAQLKAVDTEPSSAEERRSVVRKIYLYFYLFAATMTILTSAVYIVYQILLLILGERSSGNLLIDLGQAIAFILIAAGVLFYHGAALRGDTRQASQEQAKRIAGLRVVVLDGEEGSVGQAVLEALRREIPELDLVPIGLTEAAAQSMNMEIEPDAIPEHLAGAGLIIGPWDLIVEKGSESPAEKLLLPMWKTGWNWAGVERWSQEDLSRKCVQAAKQFLEGEEIGLERPMGCGGVSAAVIGGLFLLWLTAMLFEIFM